MTEQELREKISELMTDLMVDVSLKKLQKYDGDPIEKGRQYIASHNDRLEPIMTLITQYGDTREREGRIDELVRADCRKKGDVVPGGEVMVHCCKEAIMGHYHCSNWQAKERRIAELKEEV